MQLQLMLFSCKYTYHDDSVLSDPKSYYNQNQLLLPSNNQGKGKHEHLRWLIGLIG